MGQRLKEERERLGMTQPDFAAKGGVTKVSQYNYESGRRAPDGAYLAAVAAIGVDVQYIITGQRSSASAGLAPDEAALVDNYRHSSPEHKASLRTISAALAKPQVKKGDGGENAS